MITFSLPLRRLAGLLVAIPLSVCVGAPPSTNSSPAPRGAPQSGSHAATAQPLVTTPSVLWHRVLDQQNNRLGAVTDILVEMPSGRIAFFAVKPSQLFERPRVLPPDALENAGDGALKLKGSLDAWYNAPILSWNQREVDAVTRNGLELRGYYEAAWAPPTSPASSGVAILGHPAQNRPPTPYVSLRALQNTTVLDPAHQQIGAIAEFLIDWPQRRVTHAIVSHQEPSLTGAVSNGFAIPVPLLNPPAGGSEVIANVTPQTLQRAPRLTNAAQAAQSAGVFRYVAPSALANNSR